MSMSVFVYAACIQQLSVVKK